MNEEETIEVINQTKAIQRGHFQLSSGLHADTYYQCALALEKPGIAEKMGDSLAKLFDGSDIDVVVSPAIGGIVLGFTTALSLGKRFIWAERANGVMVFRRGFSITHGERVLVIEDVVTTGGSVKEVIELVRAEGGKIAGLACLLNRGGSDKIAGTDLRALVNMMTNTYTPEDCPLCKAGRPIESPGSKRI